MEWKTVPNKRTKPVRPVRHQISTQKMTIQQNDSLSGSLSGAAVVPSEFIVFQKKHGLDAGAVELLLQHPRGLQEQVLQDFCPRPKSKDVNRLFRAFLRQRGDYWAKYRTSGDDSHSRKAKLLSFQRKHNLDKRAVDSLLKHPVELQDEVISDFSPFKTTANVCTLFNAFLKQRASCFRERAALAPPDSSLHSSGHGSLSNGTSPVGEQNPLGDVILEGFDSAPTPTLTQSRSSMDQQFPARLQIRSEVLSTPAVPAVVAPLSAPLPITEALPSLGNIMFEQKEPGIFGGLWTDKSFFSLDSQRNDQKQEVGEEDRRAAAEERERARRVPHSVEEALQGQHMTVASMLTSLFEQRLCTFKDIRCDALEELRLVPAQQAIEATMALRIRLSAASRITSPPLDLGDFLLETALETGSVGSTLGGICENADGRCVQCLQRPTGCVLVHGDSLCTLKLCMVCATRIDVTVIRSTCPECNRPVKDGCLLPLFT